MNLCQSFKRINPLIMMINKAEIEKELVNDGFWINIFDEMKNSHRQELCESVVNAPLYVFEKSYIETYNFLQRTYNGIIYNQIYENKFLWKRVAVPVLLCSSGNSNIFLAKYSKHDDYIIFSEDHEMFCPVGFVTKSYDIEDASQKRDEYARILIDELYTKDIESHIRLVNELNWKKLCATFVYFLYDNKNAFLTSKLGFYEFRKIPNKVQSVQCKINENEEFYILQLPDMRNEIIIFSQIFYTIFDILNLHSEDKGSSSSG